MRNKFLVVLICTTVSLLAQQPAASLHGTLTDSSGAIIPAASIALSGRNAQKSTQTLADGTYAFSGLAEGDYKVAVSWPGFATFEHPVTIHSGVAEQFPIQLTPATGTQEVTVTADRGPEISVDPSQNAATVSIKNSDLDALPDDPDDLSDMLTALAGPSAGNGEPPPLMVDGFSGGQLPPKNTIKEIKLNQNPFSAEYEYLGFGRIEIITKPGTDSLHGNVQLTDSDAFFNSRNPYAANKAAYVNRAFNETLSDSFKHKLSWTLNANQNTVDNDAIIHAVTLDPNTLATVPVNESVLTPRHNYAGTARVDYQISTNHSATARYTYTRNDRDNNGIGGYSLASRAYSSDGSSKELQVTETAVISPAMATETRFLNSRNSNRQYGDTSLPAINIDSSFTTGSNQVGAAYNTYNRYDLQNVSTFIHGTHTVRFGVRWTNTESKDYSPANFGGTFTFLGGTGPQLDSNNQPIPNTSIPITSLEQYRRTLLFQKMGYPIATIQTLGGGASEFSIAGGNPYAAASDRQFEPFIQDDWRVRPNVTLSIGLRHEQQSEYTNDPVPVAPRLGLAWSPHSTAAKPGKTVIRLGAGVFFDRFGTNPLIQAAHYNGVNEQQYLITNPAFLPQNIPSLATLAAQQQPPVTWKIQPSLKPDVDTMEAVTLERQLPRKSMLTVTYLHITGNHFPIIVNINTPYPGTYNPADPTSGTRPYGNAAGNIFQYESDGIYRQKLTFVKYEANFGKAVSLTANYTLQFSEHDGNWMATPSNPYNFMQDYGRAGYDRRHQINLVATIKLPFKLQLNPMLVGATGAPYDLTIGHDLNGDSFGSDRPAFATDLSRPSVVITKFGAFDTDPMPGQTIVPHNYLMGAGMWNVNARLGRTFSFGEKPAAPGNSAPNATPDSRFKLNFNVDVNNVFNHLNPGGYVGDLSSPLFGQATSILLFRETSNLRRVQFGTSFTF
jgi:Carboxypeptidase regulatory-like domain